jgi:hypothetical protein
MKLGKGMPDKTTNRIKTPNLVLRGGRALFFEDYF